MIETKTDSVTDRDKDRVSQWQRQIQSQTIKKAKSDNKKGKVRQ